MNGGGGGVRMRLRNKPKPSRNLVNKVEEGGNSGLLIHLHILYLYKDVKTGLWPAEFLQASICSFY